MENLLSLKANALDVTNLLALKTDKTYTDTNLNLKANSTDVNSSLALKADKTYTDNNLSLKADSSDVNSSLALKADISTVSAIETAFNREGRRNDNLHQESNICFIKRKTGFA